MSRLDRIERQLAQIADGIEEKKEKKKFKMPFRSKSAMKKGSKPGMVTVLYLTQKYEMKFIVTKIVQGDTIVIENKAHTLNPKMIWRWGKHTAYIIREIDRVPVSNEDYDDVKRTGGDTSGDVALIKAVLGARQKPGLGDKKNWIVAIIIIVIVAAVLFAVFGGIGGGTP